VTHLLALDSLLSFPKSTDDHRRSHELRKARANAESIGRSPSNPPPISPWLSRAPRGTVSVRKYDWELFIGSPANRPSMGFVTLRRFQARAATSAEFASPGYATPSGFLNLLTPYSARTASALFHAESVRGFLTPRGFPLPVAAAACAACYPSVFSLTLRCYFALRFKETKIEILRWILRARRSKEHLVEYPIATPDSRIFASGRSVRDEVELPVLHRPILSQPFSPSRISPLESRSRISTKSPLLGFPSVLDCSNTKVAL